MSSSSESITNSLAQGHRVASKKPKQQRHTRPTSKPKRLPSALDPKQHTIVCLSNHQVEAIRRHGFEAITVERLNGEIEIRHLFGANIEDDLPNLRFLNVWAKLSVNEEANSAPVLGQTTAKQFFPQLNQERINLYRSLFKGRDDAYSERWEPTESKGNRRGGYKPARKHDWEAHKRNNKECPGAAACPDLELTDFVLRRHLEFFDGSAKPKALGLFPRTKDFTCQLLVFDFDSKNTEEKTWQKDTINFHWICEEMGVPAYIERSRSGEGGHVWVFFDQTVPIAEARKFGSVLVQKYKAGFGRGSFDKMLPFSNGSYGGIIALPLQIEASGSGNSLFLDEDMEPYADQWEFLRSIQRMHVADVNLLVESNPTLVSKEDSDDAAHIGEGVENDTHWAKERFGKYLADKDNPFNRYEQACEGRSLGLSMLTNLELMREAGLSDEDDLLEQKVKNAYRRKDAQGSQTAQFEFADLEPTMDSVADRVREDEEEPDGEYLPKNHPVTKLKKADRVLRSGRQSPEAGKNSKGHAKIAYATIQRFSAEGLVFTEGHFFRCKNNIWKKEESERIEQEVLDTFMKRGESVEYKHIRSASLLVKTICYEGAVSIKQPPRSIACPNGELTFSNGAWELRPHRKEHFITSPIAVAYDKNAKAPRFERFLEEIFEPLADPDEDLNTLRAEHQKRVKCAKQYLGYSLTTDVSFERFLMLLGRKGSNGKSRLIEVVQKLVGAGNAAALDPSKFGEKFSRALLHRRLVNIVAELDKKCVLKDGSLKAFITGDLIQAENKFKSPFGFNSFAKHWFGTNHLPHTDDLSTAFFRRPIIVRLDQKFEGERCDKDLPAKLEAELPGILNVALEGLSSLYQDGDFTEPASSLDIKDAWRDGRTDLVFLRDDEEDRANGQEAVNSLLEWLKEKSKSPDRKTKTPRLFSTAEIQQTGPHWARGIATLRRLLEPLEQAGKIDWFDKGCSYGGKDRRDVIRLLD